MPLPQKIDPVAPGDTAWFGWDFSALLEGVSGVTGSPDSITEVASITFTPPGPVVESIAINGGTIVVALLTGFVGPGCLITCSVNTAQGQTLNRSFYVTCKVL